MDGTQDITPARRAPAPLDAALAMGPVRLVVRDLEAVSAFWQQHVGLRSVGNDDGVEQLGAGGEVLLELEHRPDAPLAHPRATGLYHLALRVPTRRDLALVLHRASAHGTPLQGAADHLVSEALYLADPEGNGIEIYRDRPRETWAWGDAGLAMGTEPLDVEGVLEELTGEQLPQIESESAAGLPQGTSVGHVHLKTSDVAATEDWYLDVVGLDVTVRIADTASFLSAGGYHHHLGLNAWHSRGGPAAEPGSAGLAHYTLVVRHTDDLHAVADRANDAGTAVKEDASGPALLLRDPGGVQLRLVAAAS